jgi:hypothetical protein
MGENDTVLVHLGWEPAGSLVMRCQPDMVTALHRVQGSRWGLGFKMGSKLNVSGVGNWMTTGCLKPAGSLIRWSQPDVVTALHRI